MLADYREEWEGLLQVGGRDMRAGAATRPYSFWQRALRQFSPLLQSLLVAHNGVASWVVMQKPPGPQLWPSLQPTQSAAVVHTVRQTLLTQVSLPPQSLLTLHSSFGLWSAWQARARTLPCLMGEPQVSAALSHLLLPVQFCTHWLLTHSSPLLQSLARVQLTPVLAAQTPPLHTWPLPQSVVFAHLLTHWPLRQARPSPQWLLNWQVFPPPQSPAQVPHLALRQIPPGQALATEQPFGLGGLPGTQVPRRSQTKAPRALQSLSAAHFLLAAQSPFLQ